MARFATLTGVYGEELYFNMDRIEYLEKVKSDMLPGHYAPTGKYEWTTVYIEGKSEGILVRERVEDILTAVKK